MYIDDKRAKEIIMNIIEAEEDEENLKELDKWIEEMGIEYVFNKVFEMFRDI